MIPKSDAIQFVDETFVRALEGRRYQLCQARNRVRGRRNCAADRDRPAGFTRASICGDSPGLAIFRHGVRVARRWLKKARRIASDVVFGRERAAIRDLVSSNHRSDYEKRAANGAEN